MTLSRRKFFTLAGASAASVAALPALEAYYARVARGQSFTGVGYGPLFPKRPANARELTSTILGDLSQERFLSLPRGFNYRVLSMTGMPMSDGTLVPAGHDGMAAFPGPGDRVILVRNHELSTSLPATYNYPVSGSPRYSSTALGGTTTLVVGPDRKVRKDFVSLAGTRTNCAGGPTPWGSWITCEETFSDTDVKHGYTFEVVANVNSGVVTPVPITAMGRFSHEAIAVDPATGYIYETEDRGDSCFYQFRPNGSITAPGQLASVGGSLYALKIKGFSQAVNTTNNATFYPDRASDTVRPTINVGDTFAVEWVQVDNVDPTVEGRTGDVAAGQVGVRYQSQAKGAAIFYRGEGCWYGNGLIYFVSTQAGPPGVGNTPSSSGEIRGNGQVWAYNPANETLTLVVEAAASGALLDEPDNVTVTPFGDLFLCEDSSDNFQYIVGVTPDGELYQFAQNTLFSQVTNDPAKDPFIGNEFAGACFSPDGKTLFVNVQTPGLTFAIWGPWDRR